MAQQDLWAEKINIFHTHDGEDISKYIQDKLTSKNYGFQVKCYTFGDEIVTSLSTAVCVIILTEESLIEFKSRNKEFLNNLCPNCAPVVVLNFESSTGMDNDSVKKMVSNKGIHCSEFKVIAIGTGRSFKKALTKIISYADYTERKEMPNVKTFIIHPTEIWKDSQEIMVVFKKEIDGKSKVEVRVRKTKGVEWTFEAKRKAPAYMFTPEGIVPGTYDVEVLVDDVSTGKTKLILNNKMQLLSSLLTDVTHPIDLLCQSLDINVGDDDLDRELVDMLTRSGENPLCLQFMEGLKMQGSSTKCELPTLLHFGAKFRLKCFCEEFLKFPCGKRALNIKNKDGKKPYNVAAMAQAHELVTILMPIEEDNEEENAQAANAEEDGYMTMNDLKFQMRERKASNIKSPDELRFSSSPAAESVTMRRHSRQRRESGYVPDSMTSSLSTNSITSTLSNDDCTRRMTMMMMEDDENVEYFCTRL